MRFREFVGVEKYSSLEVSALQIFPIKWDGHGLTVFAQNPHGLRPDGGD